LRQVGRLTRAASQVGSSQTGALQLPEPHEAAAAQWSPYGRQIISETTRGQLFVVRVDGTCLAHIKLQTATNKYFAFEPDWSPDGTRIVFCMVINGQEDIYTANVNGTDLVQVRIIDPDTGSYRELPMSDPELLTFCYVWRPDAKRLACESFSDSARPETASTRSAPPTGTG
jgi:Tol biopolymer transport system component